MSSHRKKVCIITGANAGIGKAAAIQIAQKGYKVIMACRNKQRAELALAEAKEESGSNDLTLVLLDISDQASIREFAATVLKGNEQIDCLIHNAAQFDISQKKPLQTVDSIESIWATNHIGPIYLTSLLLERMKQAQQGRILTVASQGLVLHPNLKIDLNDPEFEQRKFSVPKAYYQSKLAQIMYTYWLAEKLKPHSISVNCIRVTNVKIDIDRYPNISSLNKFLYGIKSRFSISAEQMAETYTYLATHESLKEETGGYFDEKQRKVNSSKYSFNTNAQNQVMELSKTYLPKDTALT